MNAPEAWFWAHDAQPDQIDALVTPGMRLMRLSRYGSRYAALLYRGSGPEHLYRLDVDAATAAAAAGTVSITAADGPRFSVVVGERPTTVQVDLDDASVVHVAGVVDIATYVVDGVRRYAVVVDSTATTSVRTGVNRRDLDEVPHRLRANGDGRYTAVVGSEETAERFWYADLDADGVARQLERHRAYPVDLDAILTPAGVRFTVVMQHG